MRGLSDDMLNMTFVDLQDSLTDCPEFFKPVLYNFVNFVPGPEFLKKIRKIFNFPVFS